MVHRPKQECLRNEFGSIVAAKKSRSSVEGNKARDHFDDAARSNAAGDVDRETLATKFFEHGDAVELSIVGGSIEDEIDRSNLIDARWSINSRRVRAHTFGVFAVFAATPTPKVLLR